MLDRYVSIKSFLFHLVCEDGLAGPNCSLTCDCEFGVCNTNATSESNKCTCATGYSGDKCDQVINYCNPGEWFDWNFNRLICFLWIFRDG